YDLAMDGALWQSFFLQRWPLGEDQWESAGESSSSSSSPTSVDPFLKNWFGLYKQKHILQTTFAPIVIDCGSFSWKALLLFPRPPPGLSLRKFVRGEEYWRKQLSSEERKNFRVGYTPSECAVDTTPALLTSDFVVQEIENLVADTPSRSDLHT